MIRAVGIKMIYGDIVVGGTNDDSSAALRMRLVVIIRRDVVRSVISRDGSLLSHAVVVVGSEMLFSLRFGRALALGLGRAGGVGSRLYIAVHT